MYRMRRFVCGCVVTGRNTMSENGKPNITKATRGDLQEILSLQYLAYQSEARLLNDFDIPPLKQTFQEISEEYDKGIVLKAEYGGNIIGSVRGYCEGDTLYIGKLIVHPEMQGRGIGTRLLTEIERRVPNRRYELFTSSESKRNLRLYERLGYKAFDRRQIDNNLTFIYLEKYGEGVECEV